MQQLLIAHSLGIAGEVFNFAGAVLLGVDLFRRGQFRKQEENLLKLRDFAMRNRLQSVRYMNITVALSDFQELIAEKRARKYGIAGASFLAGALLYWSDITRWKSAICCD
jgi:hypothetical protein